MLHYTRNSINAILKDYMYILTDERRSSVVNDLETIF